MAQDPASARRRLREKQKTFIQRAKSLGACVDCGGRFLYVVMDFHHRDRASKRASVNGLIKSRASIRRVKEEIRKCDLLCANCHRLREHIWAATAADDLRE